MSFFTLGYKTDQIWMFRKSENLIRSQKEQAIVESNDCQLPEDTYHIEKIQTHLSFMNAVDCDDDVRSTK